MTAPAATASPLAPSHAPGSPAQPPSQVQMIALDEFPDAAGRTAQPGKPLVNLANPLHNVRTTLQVCVGSASLTVGELMGAVERQVIVLDRGVQQPVDLVLEGQVVARGQLVAVGEQFAVRITELPVALGLDAPSAP